VTRLVLCRHGHPDRRRDVDALVCALADVQLASVYTSPLTRAATAAAAIGIAHGLVPVVVGDLREIDFGEVDGLPFQLWPPDLRADVLEQPTQARFPGGETFRELQRRAVAALETIIDSHPVATVAVITHAGTIRAVFAAWLGMHDDAVFRIDQQYGAVNVVDWIDGIPFVRLVNGSPQTSPLAFDPGASRAAL
jgi:broad specificity phosphatase PhoE